jgi:hypothetical protein
LEPGDVVVLFTDGVAESGDLAGSEFGTRGILELIRSHCGDPARQILEAEIPPVRSWRPSMKRPAAFNPVARSSTT